MAPAFSLQHSEILKGFIVGFYNNVGVLIVRIGFPLKGSLKGSIVGFCNIGASIIRNRVLLPIVLLLDRTRNPPKK